MSYIVINQRLYDRRGGVEIQCSLCIREIGVRSPFGTDLSR